MDQVPDDVLLMILKNIDFADILSCRLACKRLEGLAKHHDVWRERHFDSRTESGLASCGGNDTFCRWTCPVLRQAPVLESLLVATPALECSLLFTTRCAVHELQIEVRPGGSLHAALAIRHQEALGRLRHLSLRFDRPDAGADASILFETLAATCGLETLEISGYPTCLPSALSPHDCTVPRSALRSFSWNVAAQETAPHYNLVLARHATTLEEVGLTSYCALGAVFASSPSTAPLLAGTANLRILSCPLLPGLPAVAGCKSLREVKLYVMHQTQPDLHGAREFLRSADQLNKVTLQYVRAVSADEEAAHLVTALASSGLSKLECLIICNEAAGGGGTASDFPQLLPLLSALPSLSALRDLEVNTMIPDLLLGITPTTAPALRSLKLRVFKFDSLPCIHSWTHTDVIRSLLLANPSLELHLLCRPKYCPIIKPCVLCSMGCQHRLWTSKDISTEELVDVTWLVVSQKHIDH